MMRFSVLVCLLMRPLFSKFVRVFVLFCIFLAGCASSLNVRVLPDPSDKALGEGEALIVVRAGVPIRNAQLVFQIDEHFYYSGPLRQNHLVVRRVPAGTLRISHIAFPHEGKAIKLNVTTVTVSSRTINYLGYYDFRVDEVSNNAEILQFYQFEKDMAVAESVYPNIFASGKVVHNVSNFLGYDFSEGVSELPPDIVKPDADRATIVLFRDSSFSDRLLELRVDDRVVGNIKPDSYISVHVTGGATVISAALEGTKKPPLNQLLNIVSDEYYVFRWQKDGISEGVQRVSPAEMMRVIKSP